MRVFSDAFELELRFKAFLPKVPAFSKAKRQTTDAQS